MRWRAEFIKNVCNALGVLLVFLVACSSTEKMEKMGVSAFPAIKQNKPSLEVLQRPVMKADFGTIAEDKGKQKVSLVLRSAPLGEVLRTLARQAGYNLVIGKGVPVDEDINVDIRNIPFFKALDYVTREAGLRYVVEGDVIWIVGKQLDVEMFRLDLLNLIRGTEISGEVGGNVYAYSSSTSISSIACSVCSMIGLRCFWIDRTLDIDNSTTTTDQLGNKTLDRDVEFTSEDVGKENVITGFGKCYDLLESDFSKYLSCVESVVSTISQVCSDDKGRFVVVDRSMGYIIIGADKYSLFKVRRYIGEIRNLLQRQVVLDVKITEVELKHGLEFGIDWTKVFGNIFKGHYSVSFSQSHNISGTPEVPGFFTLGITPRGGVRDPFRLAVRALEKYGKVTILSSPRVSVVNNRSAVIKVGENMRFVVSVSAQTETETNTIGCDVETQEFFVGISFFVVPYIGDDGTVTIHVHPKITELKGVKSYKSACGDIYIEKPEFYVREMDTIVKVRSGDTLIIGGLIKNEKRGNDYRTPILGDIPGLGYLFSRKEKENMRTELFIFITPHVIYSSKPLEESAWGLSTGSVDVVGR